MNISIALEPDEILERLLTLNESIVGPKDNSSLTSVVHSLLTETNFEERFNSAEPIMQRLIRLAELQRRITHSGFDETHRDELIGILDDISVRIAMRESYFAQQEAQTADPVCRIEMYLQLLAAIAFAKGTMVKKTRQAILETLGSANFTTDLSQWRGIQCVRIGASD